MFVNHIYDIVEIWLIEPEKQAKYWVSWLPTDEDGSEIYITEEAGLSQFIAAGCISTMNVNSLTDVQILANLSGCHEMMHSTTTAKCS